MGDNGGRAISQLADQISFEVEIQLCVHVHNAVFPESWDASTRFGIQHNEEKTWRYENDAFFTSIRPVSNTSCILSRSTVSTHALVRPVQPQRLTGGGIDRYDVAPRAGRDVKNAFRHDGRHFALRDRRG